MIPEQISIEQIKGLQETEPTTSRGRESTAAKNVGRKLKTLLILSAPANQRRKT